MAKKRFPGGWEFDVWDENVAYDQYDTVYYEGYLYRAVVATSAGDNPLTAETTFTFTDQTLTNTTPGDPMDTVYLELPKWVLWDLGADYYYGLLKGKPTGIFDPLGKNSTQGARTIVVRSNFSGSSTISSDEHTYDNATQASYEGYGFPAGMTSDWDGGVYAPSMVTLISDLGAPSSFTLESSGGLEGIIYQPTAFLAVASKATFEEGGLTKLYPSIYWDSGGLSSNLTIGGLFATVYSMGVSYNNGDFTTAPLSDNWTNEPGYNEYTIITNVIPDPAVD